MEPIEDEWLKSKPETDPNRFVFEIVNPPNTAYDEAIRPLINYDTTVKELMKFMSISSFAKNGIPNVSLSELWDKGMPNIHAKLMRDELYGIVRDGASNSILGGVSLHMPGFHETIKKGRLNDSASLVDDRLHISMVELTNVVTHSAHQRKGVGSFAIRSIMNAAYGIGIFKFVCARSQPQYKYLFLNLGFKVDQKYEDGTMGYILDVGSCFKPDPHPRLTSGATE